MAASFEPQEADALATRAANEREQQERFERLAGEAAAGSEQAARAMLAEPARLKALLDAMAGRFEREGALGRPRGPAAPWGVPAAAGSSSARFAERGLPASAKDLAEQYRALAGKQGRADYKSDIQGIERAVLAGSASALREIAERSPMALWAMDFSLSEYESENLLAFAAKYAPAGADVEIVECLRGMGGSLPSGRVRLEVGAAVMHGAGIGRKAPKQCAVALAAAGYEFSFADGMELLRDAAMEKPEHQQAHLQASGAPEPWPQPNLAREKVQWLEEIQARGAVDWSAKLSPDELATHAAGMWGRASGRDERRVADYLALARAAGGAGLGAWVGLASAPLRGPASWGELGPWLAKAGLASEALAAAQASGASLTWAALLPWAESEQLRLATGAPAAGKPDQDGARRL